MSTTLEEIEEKARQLPASEREKLAQKLFESVHNQELTDVDETWLTVAEDRFLAYQSGRDLGIDEKEFFTRVHRNLGWK